MRALKNSYCLAKSHTIQPRKARDVDALLLVAESSGCPNSVDQLNLIMLCAIMTKMSARQRVLLVKLLVKSFVVSTCYVPADAQQIPLAAELPPVLEGVAERIQSSQTWLAWTDNRRTWFVVAEMSTDRGRGGDAAVIRILFHDEDGECVAAGTWAFSPHGKWRFDSVRAIDVPTVVTADA